jgi:hypothetical protein
MKMVPAVVMALPNGVPSRSRPGCRRLHINIVDADACGRSLQPDLAAITSLSGPNVERTASPSISTSDLVLLEPDRLDPAVLKISGRHGDRRR